MPASSALHAYRVFFYWYGDHRDLHSFPTRRSSDLSGGVTRSSSSRPRRTSTPSSVDADARSEEHTSELQSLRHLVCRLLLEKKKTAAPSSRVTSAADTSFT